MELYIKIIYSLVIVLLLAYLIKKKGYLDDCGIYASSIMAFIILISTEISWLILLFSFLVLGSLVSKIGYSTKDSMKLGECKRTIKNVLANGIMAVLFVLAYAFGILNYDVALIGYAGSIAAATSDTFSSELGVLSKETPRLITTLKKVEKGTDGGITLFGTLLGLLGSFSIGFLAFLLFKDLNLIWIATVAGLLGNLSDSLVGALFERKGIINNEHVNFIATLVGSLSAILIYTKIF
ncbi:MAG: hypothetical protein PWP15_1369 [Methanothermococcus sp.]|jgi:uncharacterized protein (TIGR00297 family)|uniref:TIGR00297 family protein n=1 Tax=Methanothermococcus TaxID=155862 RepID=UPI000365516A|nr:MULTISPECIES: TIGR00297 family protein [Methanothermococcus]MDK2790860.1 hypothetical protein [Methanothermococcus sp.]MDK2987712.1 hypothetical protein [Methanothermococcus sp.]